MSVDIGTIDLFLAIQIISSRTCCLSACGAAVEGEKSKINDVGMTMARSMLACRSKWYLSMVTQHCNRNE